MTQRHDFSLEAALEKMADMEVVGAIIEFDPDEAEAIGAFIEDALSLEDAQDAMYDGGDYEQQG